MNINRVSKRKKRSKANEGNKLVCPYCGSTHIIYDESRGEYVCENCGNVVEKGIDPGPEWRAFTPEQRERRTRVGAPVTPLGPEISLSTIIDWRNKDSSGHELAVKKRVQISRLRKINKIFNIGVLNEKNLRLALSEIERIGLQIGIPKVIREEAAILYRKAAKKKLIKGRSVESMVAACIYAACKLNSMPRSLDEISKVSKASRKDISRSFRLLLSASIIKKLPPSKPSDFIPRIISELRLSMKTQQLAFRILKEAQSIGISSGKMPEGIAAASVYLATILTGERRTQRDVSSAANVTEVTIRNRFKELITRLSFEIVV